MCSIELISQVDQDLPSIVMTALGSEAAKCKRALTATSPRRAQSHLIKAIDPAFIQSVSQPASQKQRQADLVTCVTQQLAIARNARWYLIRTNKILASKLRADTESKLHSNASLQIDLQARVSPCVDANPTEWHRVGYHLLPLERPLQTPNSKFSPQTALLTDELSRPACLQACR